MALPSSPSWQLAWERAQPYLASIRDSFHSISTSPRIIRVGQLDAELLDQQLVHLLREPLNKALALVNPSFTAHFDPELTFFIQLTLYKLSIWKFGASYGAKLQDLVYKVPRSSSTSRIPRSILLIHGIFTVVIPYLHTRLRAYALSRAWPDTPSSDPRHKAWGLITTCESSYTLLSLLSFISFLWNGRYRTIADRLLGMTLAPSRPLVKRDVSYEFMNRQMVWHAFTEFLLFLLPLISGRSIRRRLTRLRSSLLLLLPSPTATPTATDKARKIRGRYYSLPLSQCAICAENESYNFDLSSSGNLFSHFDAASTEHIANSNPADIAEDEDAPPQFSLNTPYITSCGHEYCYYCIAERMVHAAEEGSDERGWECLRCAQPVSGAERVVGGKKDSMQESKHDGEDRTVERFQTEFWQ